MVLLSFLRCLKFWDFSVAHAFVKIHCLFCMETLLEFPFIIEFQIVFCDFILNETVLRINLYMNSIIFKHQIILYLFLEPKYSSIWWMLYLFQNKLFYFASTRTEAINSILTSQTQFHIIRIFTFILNWKSKQNRVLSQQHFRMKLELCTQYKN